VFEAQRHHLASYLAEPQPTGEQFAFKTLEQRLAAISGFYAYALEVGSSTVTPELSAPRLPSRRTALKAPSV